MENNISSLSSNSNLEELFMLQELVKRMKGSIETKSDIGQATTFVVTIPKNFFNEKESNSLDALDRVEDVKERKCFTQKVRKVLEENISDETFGIPELCKAIFISRSQLHNKIKARTGLSTSLFIRSIRLEKAKQLLENTDLNVSEVAYEVGFKDASYFSRLFTEKYGIAPSKVSNIRMNKKEPCKIINLRKPFSKTLNSKKSKVIKIRG